MIADHHMHSDFCPHAEGAPREYVEHAIALGMSEWGFAEHLPLLAGWGPRHDGTDDRARAWDDVNDYVIVVRDMAAEYAAEARVLPDIEADALDETAAALAAYPFDYGIGTVHIVGDRFGFDHPELRDQVPGDGLDRMHLETLELAGRAARSGLFDVIGHLDNAGKSGPPEDAGAVSAAASKALRAIAAAGAAVELNTAGRRGPAGESYPSPALLALAAGYMETLLFAGAPAESLS